MTQDALSQCIVELRKAFHDDAKRASVIETIPRLGVRLIGPVSNAPPAANAPNARPRRQRRLVPADASGTMNRLRHAARGASRAVGGSPPVALASVLVAVLGSAAFWFAQESGLPWRDPLAGAEFARVTDFVGAEEHATVSADGRLVAFVSDRDGAWDVWLGQIGTGDFQNLTHGEIPELRNPAVRMLQFSPEGRKCGSGPRQPTPPAAWSITAGPCRSSAARLRRDVEGISELDWSPDGERVVYHPSAPGDPLYIMARRPKGGGHQIYAAAPGIHCHFPIWSRDGKSIYFVMGFAPTKWTCGESMSAAGRRSGSRSTIRASVSQCCSTSERCSTSRRLPDGSGPWLHALDLSGANPAA